MIKIYQKDNRIKINQTNLNWQLSNRDKIITNNKKYLNRLNINIDTEKIRYVYLHWSYLVRKRDNFTCQVCGLRNKVKNIAHHILHKAKNPELSLNINNGITLCRKCHREVHGWIS